MINFLPFRNVNEMMQRAIPRRTRIAGLSIVHANVDVDATAFAHESELVLRRTVGSAVQRRCHALVELYGVVVFACLTVREERLAIVRRLVDENVRF